MVIESQTYMVINIAVLIIAVVQVLVGIKRGFLIQLMDCVGLLVSLFVAWLFSPVLSEWAAIVPETLNPARETVLGPWVYGLMNQIVWFIAIFIVCRLVLLLVRPIIKMLGKIPLVKQVNQLLGGLFGLVNTGIWLVVFSIILMLPFFENGQQVIDATLLSMPGRAAAVINEKLLEMPQDENQLQKLVEGWDQLTDEDRTMIKDWLNDNQLTFQNLQELLNSLKGEGQ
ncbi:CvpA family protein [Holdemania massiliensis]|uniref:CvpA family protein n=1 Tax=Holdemania massiliensis TaxID=1468449 RepID=UPI001F05BC60|nr:CvpA family protein [Holdemania massiliensis]MCH1941014.1 CvpA family protein [Holdemania massiliensis]